MGILSRIAEDKAQVLQVSCTIASTIFEAVYVPVRALPTARAVHPGEVSCLAAYRLSPSTPASGSTQRSDR